MSASLIKALDLQKLPDSGAICIFNHIPKTAGSSIRRILTSIYSDNSYIKWDARFINKEYLQRNYACYGGHWILGLHQLLPSDKQAFYFTMLRDPQQTAISMYTFRCFLRVDTPTTYGFKQHIISTSKNPLIRYLGAGCPDKARSTLFQDHAFFGIMERFNDSLFYFSKFIHRMADADHVWINASDKAKIEIDNETLELFNELNAEDMALYHEAMRVFEERFAAIDKNGCQSNHAGATQRKEINVRMQDAYALLSEHPRDALYSPSLTWLDKKRHFEGRSFFEAALVAGMAGLCMSSLEFLRRLARTYVRTDATVLEQGKAAFFLLRHQDPDICCEDSRHDMGEILFSVIKSHCRLFPDVPIPRIFLDQLGALRAHPSALAALEACPTIDKAEFLDEIIAVCPPEALPSPSLQAEAHALFAESWFRLGFVEKALRHAQSALHADAWNVAAAVLAARAMRALSGRKPVPAALFERYAPYMQKMNISTSLSLEFASRLLSGASDGEREMRAFVQSMRQLDCMQEGSFVDPALAVPYPYQTVSPADLPVAIPVLCFLDAPAWTLALFAAEFLQGRELIVHPTEQYAGEAAELCGKHGWSAGQTLPAGLRRWENAIPALQEQEGAESPRPAEAIFFTEDFPEAVPERPLVFAGHATWRAPLVFPVQRVFLKEPSLLADGRTRDLVARLRAAKKIAVWGRGRFYELYLKPFLHDPRVRAKLACFIETNPAENARFEALPVLSPKEASAQSPDAVIVATPKWESIARQAKEAGLNNLCYFDYRPGSWMYAPPVA